MNLLEADWIPVRRKDGSQDWISPVQISDPEVIALAANRADFNGALAQFLIGLLQTTTPMDSLAEWEAWLNAPPSADVLAGWFESVKATFVLDGEGPRFMQDFSLRAGDAEAKLLSALLIESAGEKSIRDNTDHFVKRDTAAAACPACSAHALLTLQLNAPAGGAGHRTSLRGGGPLTTLVISDEESGRSLWSDIWLNVQGRSGFLEQAGDSRKHEPHFSFPWLADISLLQKKDGDLAAIETHPAHVFWATPRRIRLDFDRTARGVCDLCGRTSDRLITQFVTKNYGLNYKGGWNHPLSPYYENKPGEWLPLHPQPGGYGYKHWLGWVLGSTRQGKKQRPATVVTRFLANRHPGGSYRLWAFGYDMDNMKARCWYESTLPIYGLSRCEKRAQETLQAVIGQWIEGAELGAWFLRSAVKSSWFGQGTDARSDLSVIDSAFYSSTEPVFYNLLRQLIDGLRDTCEPIELVGLRRRWLETIADAAIRLFDDIFVGPSPIEIQNPRRIAEAHRRLVYDLRGDKLRQAVGLAVATPEKSGARARKKKVFKEI
jgi:CRISPR system Cascade subunit CasA